jgi:lysophospholipase L1-like esterase
MLDSNHEGHPGHRVDEILNDVDATAGMKPNVVLINAGTNDAQQNYDGMRGTFDSLKQLIEKVQNMHPQTTIVLSTILMTTNQDANARVDGFNRQIRQYMYDQADAGSPDGKIILAEMDDSYHITARHLQPDGIHPNEEGYRRMAAVWNKAISDAINLRYWVTEPEVNLSPCGKTEHNRICLTG